MRALVQRVSHASVAVGGRRAGWIGPGLLIFLGVTHADTEKELRILADKCARLRIFEDEAGKMNRSLLDAGGSALVVSQFTLYGDGSRGRRPSFTAAAAPEQARRLYDGFIRELETHGLEVASGIFGADMKVELCNDGPVTLLLEAEAEQ